MTMSESNMPDPKKPNNLTTGLILGAVALAFFIAVFIKRLWLS
jgi:hypothetical protein